MNNTSCSIFRTQLWAHLNYRIRLALKWLEFLAASGAALLFSQVETSVTRLYIIEINTIQYLAPFYAVGRIL